MKKSYLIFAAAATLFAACSSNDTIKNDLNDAVQEKSIGFAAYSSKTTKADEVDSNQLHKFYGTFDVYGWKTVNSANSSVFNHVPVGYFGTDTDRKSVV